MTQDISVIIVGGGRVGFQTAELLDDRGHKITIVERDPAVCEALTDEWLATVIKGDATNPEILAQGGLEKADVVAGLTGLTGVNLAVCMMATRLSPDTRTVARIDHGDGAGYEEFVDAIVYPERSGARVAANEIVGSDVQTLADVTGTLDIMEVLVEEGAPAAGKQLANVRFPAGTLVISDEDGDRIAQPDTELRPGRRYVVAVEPDVVDEVMNLLRG
ncbi:TrkA family potassium uptake protein [Halomicroarcula sp. GCM10025709]|uniref:TrkA family potassium uptake protein n=1 Tax=Haloarcula TaxID=2237 RepID=UPI0024C2F263|nr:TrkA family potassium uptake protein [Halomicroarcula sp. YJ-61-S]